MTNVAARHTPVLLERCLELLGPAVSDGPALAVDGTLGMGGHTEALLERFPDLSVVGIDRDTDAIEAASERLSRFGTRFHAYHAEYDDIRGALASVGATHCQAVLLDLGVSSWQIDHVERGFSYAQDAPLDMRMNREDVLTAADVLRTWSHQDLTRILKHYGEEKFAFRIASAIVQRRDSDPITRSRQLVELVREAIPAAARATGGNPAKRTFQALRIAVNSELDVLERTLPVAHQVLTVAGRIVVMAYHSLEDRMVKTELGRASSVSAPPGLPVVPDEHQPELRLLVRGAEKASAAEVAANSRSTSVRLRAAQRLRPAVRPAA